MRNVQIKLTPNQKKIVYELLILGFEQLKLTTNEDILYFAEIEKQNISNTILELMGHIRGYKAFAEKIKKLQ